MKQYIGSGIFLACALMLFNSVHGEDDLLPRGFALAGTPEHYGLTEQKLANGSIFDYMDGGGIVYIDHGFRKLTHRKFSNSDKRQITFDRFTMETAAQALAALADQRIAPEEGSPLPLTIPNKAYRFPPDYFIYMVLDNNLIYLHVDDDNLAEILNQFAAAIIKSPEKERE